MSETANAGTERPGAVFEVDSKGVCTNCGYVACVVSHGHEAPNGGSVEQGDDWVRCELTDPSEDPPEIVCLCGSTRFKDEYRAENKRLTLRGKIVLSVGFFGHVDGWPDDGEDGQTKVDLDELHKRKIDLADRIHVINVDGYVGDSTASEIGYARSTGTAISWFEAPEGADSGGIDERE